MASVLIPVRMSIICLSDLQHALWQLGLPVLDAKAVAGHKKRATLWMLWQMMRWPLVGMAALVAFEFIGRDRYRASLAGAAVLLLAALFTWLVSAYDLQWTALDYRTYRSMYPVPAHVAATADALLQRGISETRIGVEFLKNDPILFVEETTGPSMKKRYDLIVW